MTNSFSYSDYPVIIGIDFGTTYSACSYAIAHNNEIVDITKWPRQQNNIYPKVPTLSLYRKGSKELIQWGNDARRIAMKQSHQHRPDYLLLSKFKLYLDHQQQVEHTMPPLPNDFHIIDVIADYLNVLHYHIKSELRKGFAINYSEEKYRYCLTVPAMWNDQAKAMMREAAIQANLISRYDHPDRLMLISEPEAAALYCEKKSEQFNLIQGQRFMICDAGGGTVDLVVFEIDEKDGRRTLKEVTHGHGASCGSGFLDDRMRQYIQQKFITYGEINDHAMDYIMDAFINIIKPEFDGLEDHFIDLPGSMGLMNDPSIGVDNGCLHLPVNELLLYIFDPIVNQVLDLIEHQLKQSTILEAIFLVGGFGQSNYLFRRIEEQFAHRVGMIGVPPRGELAVVRGAVYFGLYPNIVTERVSRRTYGVESRMIFQPGLDPEEYFVINPRDKQQYCRKRFSVYVKKGQSIKVNECITKHFVISYPNNTDSDLYAFDGDEPPRLTTDPQIQKVGHFPIFMPKLDGVKKGEKVKFTINMYFGLTEIKIICFVGNKSFTFTSQLDATTTSYDNIMI